jgi:hypothetical protein
VPNRERIYLIWNNERKEKAEDKTKDDRESKQGEEERMGKVVLKPWMEEWMQDKQGRGGRKYETRKKQTEEEKRREHANGSNVQQI